MAFFYDEGFGFKTFKAFQNSVVPGAARYSAQDQSEALKLIKDTLDPKPNIIKIKVSIFFVLLNIVSFIKGGNFLSKLSEDQQRVVVLAFFDSKIGLLRKGFWGLNTLAKMGYYGRPSLYKSIHYKMKPDTK